MKLVFKVHLLCIHLHKVDTEQLKLKTLLHFRHGRLGDVGYCVVGCDVPAPLVVYRVQCEVLTLQKGGFEIRVAQEEQS